MATIDVRGLRKSYGELEAVCGIGFEVEQGEVFCLLGPNGAGKSTTVEILEGYRSRSGGSVSVLGHDPERGERALRERVGIVLQNCGIQPDLSVAELLGDVRQLLPAPAAGRRADRARRARRQAGRTRRRRSPADSGAGWTSRSRSSATPTSCSSTSRRPGFDPSARRQAWSTIRNLCALGKTVFLTTHHMDEAQALAHRIAVMRAGAIVAAGTPAEIGGRAEAPSEIRFTLPAGVAPAHLPALAARGLAGTAARCSSSPATAWRPRTASPAGRSSAASSCAASASPGRAWKTSTCA